ncbi:MAG: hypothetical protein ACRD1Y_11455, partial [Terriglobales bacterium]
MADRLAPWLLAALAAATRLPLAGRSLGEADCPRYVDGVLQWLRRGPDAHWIYAKVLSPGYYAAAAWLVAQTHITPHRLLVGASIAAAIVTAPMAYWLGRRFCGPLAAASGTALFLLAPGVWWLGLEAHPAGAALLLVLAAMAAWMRALKNLERPHWGWTLIALACFSAALLLKADFALFGLIFPALALRDGAWRERRAAVAGGILFGLSLGVFFALRPGLIALTAASAGEQTQAAVARFLTLPHGT